MEGKQEEQHTLVEEVEGIVSKHTLQDDQHTLTVDEEGMLHLAIG